MPWVWATVTRGNPPPPLLPPDEPPLLPPLLPGGRGSVFPSLSVTTTVIRPNVYTAALIVTTAFTPASSATFSASGAVTSMTADGTSASPDPAGSWTVTFAFVTSKPFPA